MKYLYYEKQFYKEIDDSLANEINLTLIARPRPMHIIVDGESLIASKIEIRNPNTGQARMDQKVSIEEIKKFEHSYNTWKERVPPEERSWEFFAAVHGLITLVGIYTAPSGMKRCTNFLVRDPFRFTRFSKLYAAMQEHYAKVDYAKRKEVQELAAKAFLS